MLALIMHGCDIIIFHMPIKRYIKLQNFQFQSTFWWSKQQVSYSLPFYLSHRDILICLLYFRFVSLFKLCVHLLFGMYFWMVMEWGNNKLPKKTFCQLTFIMEFMLCTFQWKSKHKKPKNRRCIRVSGYEKSCSPTKSNFTNPFTGDRNQFHRNRLPQPAFHFS